MKYLILVIEDETAIRDMLRYALTSSGFDVAEATQCSEAEKLMSDRIPHLILLDWMLPDLSGIDFAKQLKESDKTRDIPLILLTAKAEEENKIKGLEIGADDYITKPFSPRELIARIKTVLRRGPLVTPQGIIQVGDLSINIDTHQVMIREKVIDLTPNEYRLLHFFATHQNRVYSRDQLLDRVWGGDAFVDERTVDAQIRRLRKAIRYLDCDQFIQTVRGAGYQFSTQENSENAN